MFLSVKMLPGFVILPLLVRAEPVATGGHRADKVVGSLVLLLLGGGDLRVVLLHVLPKFGGNLEALVTLQAQMIPLVVRLLKSPNIKR